MVQGDFKRQHSLWNKARLEDNERSENDIWYETWKEKGNQGSIVSGRGNKYSKAGMDLLCSMKREEIKETLMQWKIEKHKMMAKSLIVDAMKHWLLSLKQI